MNYDWNEQAEIMAGGIIASAHPHLEHQKIAHLFKVPNEDEEAKPKKQKILRNGKKITWAKASLVSDKVRALGSRFQFCIEYDLQVWNSLSIPQQEALIDHELCHFGVDADGCYMRQHDLEEFRCIVERHGLWKSDVEMFAESISKRGVLAL